MADSQKKIERLMRLHNLLCVSGEITKQQLVKVFSGYGLTDRTLNNDLNSLVFDWGAEIEKTGKGRYKLKTPANFAITNGTETNEFVSKEQLEMLYSIHDLLKNFKGLPQEYSIRALIDSFELKLGKSTLDHNIIYYDHNNLLVGLPDYFEKIYNAIKKHKMIKIDYTPFDKMYLSKKKVKVSYFNKELNSYTWVISPWILKEYNGRWQLVGHCEQFKNLQKICEKPTEGIINISLDRITSFEEVSLSAEKCPPDFLKRFDHVVGFTLGPVKTIKLKFYKESLPYVLSKPLHWTQKVVEKDVNGDWAILSYKVAINRELKQQVVQYLPYVEPVNPKKLLDDFLKVKKKR